MNVYVAALIYVDDIILLGNYTKKIAKVKSYLNNKFRIKDLDPLKYLLGIEVTCTFAGMFLVRENTL